jgi:hypothetical protein
MDWFERITGFREGDYASTRARLAMEGETLVSKVNGSRHRAGRLEVVPLQALRRRRAAGPGGGHRTTVQCLAGDARALHAAPQFAGATFQVASQFNLLEMVGPSVSPEHGVTGYMHDRTQGPACAMAAGAGTIYRNYFAPAGGGHGQTAERQIDALAPLGDALSRRLRQPVQALWAMRNGYALCTPDGLAAIARLLREVPGEDVDALRGHLAVGVHRDVDVTDVQGPGRPVVTQVYCSALPMAYTRIDGADWEPFARLVLEAAYEATLLAALEQVQRGGSSTVLLTRLGGGAFGNPEPWIDAAIWRALEMVEGAGLDVRLVSFGSVHPAMLRLQQAWNARAP